MAEKQKRPDETPSDKQTTITFANFLESVPPSQKRIVSGTIEATYAGDTHQLNLSDILIFCPSEECNGSRVFRYEGEKRYIRPKDNDFFIDYICSNCRKSHKLFALRVEGPSAQNLVVLYKYGEMPPFGPPTPPRLLRLLEDQKSLFIKGRRCEIQGLGVGAFGYYRRVVENQKNRILDEIIKVSERLGAQQPALKLLADAKSENQFLKSITMVKDALPQALLINGHNPLTLLHSALSSGLHEQSDERCLELAHDVRIVLAELSERLNQALKDEAELNSAVGRLLRVKDKS